MTDGTSDAFLSGQGIPVPLPEIEDELARLWGPAAERQGGPDLDHPAVTRVALANVVIGAFGPEAGRIDAVLDTVVARYPCRAILLASSGEPGRRVSAEVSALCHLPAPGLPQVCSERIVLHAGPEAMDLVPGAVRPLLESGLPVVVWWIGDPRPFAPLFRDLAGEANRLVLDLDDPGPGPEAVRAALDPEVSRFGRDLSWFGVTRWRELVAQFFDPAGSEVFLSGIRSLVVRASAPTADRPPRVSSWLAAWLAGQLGWSPDGRPSDDGGRRAATFRSPSGEVRVELLTEADPGLPFAEISGVTLHTEGPRGEGTFRLDRLEDRSEDVRVEACAPTYCTLPRIVRATELDHAGRVAGALESARDDPPYRQALPHLLWLLGGDA